MFNVGRLLHCEVSQQICPLSGTPLGSHDLGALRWIHTCHSDNDSICFAQCGLVSLGQACCFDTAAVGLGGRPEQQSSATELYA